MRRETAQRKRALAGWKAMAGEEWLLGTMDDPGDPLGQTGTGRRDVGDGTDGGRECDVDGAGENCAKKNGTATFNVSPAIRLRLPSSASCTRIASPPACLMPSCLPAALRADQTLQTGAVPLAPGVLQRRVDCPVYVVPLFSACPKSSSIRSIFTSKEKGNNNFSYVSPVCPHMVLTIKTLPSHRVSPRSSYAILLTCRASRRPTSTCRIC